MRKIIGYLKSCFSFKSSIIGAVALTMAVLTVFVFLNLVKYDVTIIDNGKITSTYVYSKTVEDALKEAGIKVSEYDELSQPKDSNLRETRKIIITRAKSVTLSLNGKNKTFHTTLKTVGEFLEKEGIKVDENSLLLTPPETEITDKMELEIIPKIYEEEVEFASIPFETQRKPNYNMEQGNTRVSSEGQDGEKKIIYKVLRHKGQVIDRQYVGEEVTKNPISKVIEYGTISTIRTSRGDTLRYSRELTCNASAYCLKGRTATGRYTSRGVVAVDPSVIPLGSRLFIQSSDGRYVYGYAVAADTGGAIKGNKIDLYMETQRECLNFGRRSVKVYILD